MLIVEFFPLIAMLLFYGGILFVLIYLVLKRIKEKKKEDFEKRDN